MTINNGPFWCGFFVVSVADILDIRYCEDCELLTLFVGMKRGIA